VQAGEIDQQKSRAMSDSIYKSLGLDAQVARACQFRGRQGGADRGGRAGNAPSAANTQVATNGGDNTGATGGRRGGRRGSNASTLLAGMDVPVNQASPRRQLARPALVYVVSGTSFAPRVVRVGMSDLDYTEVVSGLQEGEQVLLLTALQMQASRDSALARMRGRTGGMPGVPTGGGPGGGGPGRGRG
jgi:HlyD family secretion protein